MPQTVNGPSRVKILLFGVALSCVVIAGGGLSLWQGIETQDTGRIVGAAILIATPAICIGLSKIEMGAIVFFGLMAIGLYFIVEGTSLPRARYPPTGSNSVRVGQSLLALGILNWLLLFVGLISLDWEGNNSGNGSRTAAVESTQSEQHPTTTVVVAYNEEGAAVIPPPGSDRNGGQVPSAAKAVSSLPLGIVVIDRGQPETEKGEGKEGTDH